MWLLITVAHLFLQDSFLHRVCGGWRWWGCQWPRRSPVYILTCRLPQMSIAVLLRTNCSSVHIPNCVDLLPGGISWGYWFILLLDQELSSGEHLMMYLVVPTWRGGQGCCVMHLEEPLTATRMILPQMWLILGQRNHALNRASQGQCGVYSSFDLQGLGGTMCSVSRDWIKSVIKRLTCYVGFCVDKILPWKPLCPLSFVSLLKHRNQISFQLIMLMGGREW